MLNTQQKGSIGWKKDRKEWLRKRIKEVKKEIQKAKYTKTYRDRLTEYEKELSKLNNQKNLGGYQ